MARIVDDHVEMTPVEARQGGAGTHLLVILAISVFFAIVGLGFYYLGVTAQP